MSAFNIIKSSIIQFHSKEDGFNLYNASTSNKKFGVLNLEMEKSSMTTEDQLIHSSNDMSGSMNDPCNDGRTKMQHLHLTLENIVTLLSKNASQIKVDLEITGFDDKIEEVLEKTRVTEDPEQVTKIHNKIKAVLRSRGCTDIGIALNDAAEKLQPKIDGTKNFIFMTDGLITSGIRNIEMLKAALPEDSQNYFIGLGSDHDFKLLQELASVNMGSYYYVDKIENAGLVFGEIIHSILYTVSRKNMIVVTNGEIYDFQRNEWVTELKIPNLCGESKKDFHLRSETPETFELKIIGVANGEEFVHEESPLPSLMNEDEDGTLQSVDLRKYMYRQKTLELLAISVIIAKNKFAKLEEKDSHKILLKELRNELQTFAKEFESDEEMTAYVKQLSDDLYISETTLDSDRSLLYTIARQNAQGSGGSYNITKIEKADKKRHNGLQGVEDYEVNDDPVSRYASNTQVEVMRSCSATQQGNYKAEAEAEAEADYNSSFSPLMRSNAMDIQRSNAFGAEIEDLPVRN
jgi:hypothetical protein